MIFGLNYSKGQYYYSFSSSKESYGLFENQFYSYFNKFQLIEDTSNWTWNFDESRSIASEMRFDNNWYFPLNYSDKENFVYNLFRAFENLDVATDKVGIFFEIQPVIEESFVFYIHAKLSYFFFRIKL